jgi:RNA polymerase sigma-70 factor (ECF subfamily)
LNPTRALNQQYADLAESLNSATEKKTNKIRSMLRDTDITWRIRNGDIGQFESLFRSSYVSLVRYAKTLIKDHDTAEEIVQDLFFRLWQDKEKLNIESSLNGYLFRSVHNKCLHYIEHNKVVERHAEEMLYHQSESQETPSDILNYKELQEKIASILERLPERCGKIFTMSRFEGLKYSEIAEKLSVSIKTVEANMGRALKEFRKELAQ